MYEEYFGLIERPFSIAPDPQYLYMSSRHKEAMAHLSYGLSQGGCFIVLTGEVGTGKTTLCRNLLRELPDNVDVALILNANIDESELLQTICDELKIEYASGDSQKRLLDLINRYLLATYADNRHTVLIIDEAQLLSRDVLEQVRLLTNLETTKQKLLQIILIGQPELNDLLARNDLRQLAQRVTARYHLDALRRDEIEDYINFRLGVAGCKQPLFTRQALRDLYRLTDGIPRKINVLADHALLAAYSKNQTLVDARTVRAVSREVFITPVRSSESHFGSQAHMRRWGMAAALVALNVGLWWLFAGPDSTVPGQVSVADTPVSERLNRAAPQESFQEQSQSGMNVVAADAEPAESGAVLSEVAPDQEPSQVAGSVTVSPVYLDDSTALPAELNQGLLTVSPARENAQPADLVMGPLLETSADLTGRVAAFRRLGELWQVSLPQQILQPVCELLAQQGLNCLSVSDWPQLLRYNRPALLVVSHNAQLHRVLLLALDGDTATIQIGDAQYSVPVAELRSHWTEDGMLLWRPGDNGSQLLQRGDQSARLPALRVSLNRALANAGLPLLTSVDSDRFDMEMSQKVFALQTRFSIIQDSKIGSETYMLVNELSRPAETPVLNRRP